MSTIITVPRPTETETEEMLRLMRDIHSQNRRLLERLDKLEREQGRRHCWLFRRHGRRRHRPFGHRIYPRQIWGVIRGA